MVWVSHLAIAFITGQLGHVEQRPLRLCFVPRAIRVSNESEDLLAFRLPGATVTGFVTDFVTEAWIDITYRGQEFSINDQWGDYWFFVKDPACPDEIMAAVLDHCRLLLGQP